MPGYYPPTGFHFSVGFEGISAASADVRFQSVSGLSATIETEDVREGGVNSFKHKLPTGVSHEPLELKRGLIRDSVLTQWCSDAIEQFTFRPINLLISLLDETHQPLASWYVSNAYPVRWSVSEFDASKSEIVIESLQLHYNTFRRLSA